MIDATSTPGVRFNSARLQQRVLTLAMYWPTTRKPIDCACCALLASCRLLNSDIGASSGMNTDEGAGRDAADKRRFSRRRSSQDGLKQSLA